MATVVHGRTKTSRNEFILSRAKTHSPEAIRQMLWRELGEDVSISGINSVIGRARRSGDKRAMWRDRRGQRGNSPFKNWPGRRPGKVKAPEAATDLVEVSEADLPPTARLLLDANVSSLKCKFPLRGSGIGLIVCGADVGGKGSYCPACRERTIEPEAAEVGRLQRPAQKLEPIAERPMLDAPLSAPVRAPSPAPVISSTSIEPPPARDDVLPPDHFFGGLKRNGYSVIVTDPPWAFKTRTAAGQGRSPSRHYQTRTVEEIMTDPVADLAARDCFLFMWITGPHLVAGSHTRVFEAWGFKPSSMAFVWLKTNDPQTIRRAETWEEVFQAGLGLTTLQNAEYLVLARRGAPKRAVAGIRQLIVAPAGRHSEKPREALRRVERYAGGPGVELYSRTTLPGWNVWGDEAGKFDEAA